MPKLLTPVEVEVDVFGQAAALRLTAARRRRRPTGPAKRSCCRRARSSSPPEPSPTPCSAAKTRTISSSTAAISRRSTRTATRRSRSGSRSPTAVRVLMHLRPDGRAISFFGDLHPCFSGNVVKAMGGAKQGYPVVSRMLARRAPSAPAPAELAARLDDELRAVVHEVVRLTPNIVEVVVRAPIAARAFKPGQFYRLQNYEALARAGRRHDLGDGRAGAHRRRDRHAKRACCRRSCSRWAARPTSARC